MAKFCLDDDGVLEDIELWAVVDQAQAQSFKNSRILLPCIPPSSTFVSPQSLPRPSSLSPHSVAAALSPRACPPLSPQSLPPPSPHYIPPTSRLSPHSLPFSVKSEPKNNSSFPGASKSNQPVIVEEVPMSRNPSIDFKRQNLKRKSSDSSYGNGEIVAYQPSNGVTTSPRKTYRSQSDVRTPQHSNMNDRNYMNEKHCYNMENNVQTPPTKSNWQMTRHSGNAQASLFNQDQNRTPLKEIGHSNVNNMQLVCATETMACQPHETPENVCLAEINRFPSDGLMGGVASWMANMPSAANFKHFQQAAMDILETGDYVMMQGKPYIKKSGWRKIAFLFNISFEIKDRNIGFDNSGLVTRAEFVVRATMQTGRFAEGWGSCDKTEKRFARPNNDIPCTAETRAKNRACQDLLGIGEYKIKR